MPWHLSSGAKILGCSLVLGSRKSEARAWHARGSENKKTSLLEVGWELCRNLQSISVNSDSPKLAGRAGFQPAVVGAILATTAI